MNQDTDQDLLRCYARTGSEQAFRDLVERYINLVYSVAIRLVVDHHLAEDVTQSVFSALAQNAVKLQSCGSLSSWLHTTARNQASMLVRGEVRRRNRERNAAMNSNLPDIQPLWEQLEPELDGALGELPDADRDFILLRFFQRKTAREIGEQFRLSEEAAQKRVSRAVDRLRLVLARRGIAGSATAIAALLGIHAVIAAPVGLVASVAGQATAAGASTAAVAGGGMADILIALMTTKKWIALGTLVLAGLALAPMVLRPPSRAPRIRVQFAPAAPPPVTVSPAHPDSTMKWAEIESTDYRQFIANLRASGAPERLIRDVVGLEIYRIYLPRIRAIWTQNQAARTYWQKETGSQLTADQWKRLADVLDECRAVLVSLFGPEARVQDALNVVSCQPDFETIRLAWLPPEVSAKAAAILEPFRQEELSQSSLRNGRGFTWAEASELLEPKLNALRGVLTPEQLEEFRMREDPYAQNVRTATRFCDLSPEEFSKLVKAYNSRALDPALTMEQQEAAERRLAKVVGPDRAPSILKNLDLTYGCVLEAAESYGLAPETADRAWRLKWDAVAEHDHLSKDENLGADVRQQRLKELVARTQQAFTDLLGTNGFRMAQRDGAWWSVIGKP